MTFKVGDKVVKNPANWKPNDFDSWGRGEGVGVVLEPPFSLGPEGVDVRWPKGRCFEEVAGLLLVGMAYTCIRCSAENPVKAVGGMSGDLLARCERCGATGSMSVYDSSLGQLESRYSSRAEAHSHLGDLLLPCKCGGVYSISAPLRCHSCASPVDEPAYLSQTGRPVPANEYFGELRSLEWRK